jgi:CRP-like cAMP-binding protein
MIDPKATERFMVAPWLSGVDPETKRAILGALVEARAPADAILLARGQPNDHLTFLIEGSADIERTLSDGRCEILPTLTAPTVFGMTSFFQPRPPDVSVRARTDVWMLSLYHPAHEELRRENPRAAEALALAVVVALSERFDMIDKLLSDYLAQESSEPEQVSEWAAFSRRLFEERGF